MNKYAKGDLITIRLNEESARLLNDATSYKIIDLTDDRIISHIKSGQRIPKHA